MTEHVNRNGMLVHQVIQEFSPEPGLGLQGRTVTKHLEGHRASRLLDRCAHNVGRLTTGRQHGPDVAEKLLPGGDRAQDPVESVQWRGLVVGARSNDRGADVCMSDQALSEAAAIVDGDRLDAGRAGLGQHEMRPVGDDDAEIESARQRPGDTANALSREENIGERLVQLVDEQQIFVESLRNGLGNLARMGRGHGLLI